MRAQYLKSLVAWIVWPTASFQCQNPKHAELRMRRGEWAEAVCNGLDVLVPQSGNSKRTIASHQRRNLVIWASGAEAGSQRRRSSHCHYRQC
jgi:hypothetical protein